MFKIEILPKDINVFLSFRNGVIYPEEGLSPLICNIMVEYNDIQELYSLAPARHFSNYHSEFYDSCELLVWRGYKINTKIQTPFKVFYVFKTKSDYIKYKLKC